MLTLPNGHRFDYVCASGALGFDGDGPRAPATPSSPSWGSTALRGWSKACPPRVAAFDVINTVPWGRVFRRPSPLAPYGLEGGVSGRPICGLAREALARAVAHTDRPVISGGGIGSVEECLLRRDLRASALSLGTVFLRAPWRPRRIIREYRRRA
jgi:hypothetical protein